MVSLLYFILALSFFFGLNWLINYVLDRFEERRASHFEEKVDRYRR